jgi:hypothetical protein
MKDPLDKFYEELKTISEGVLKDLIEKREASYKINDFEIIKLKDDDTGQKISLNIEDLLQIIEVSAMLGASKFSIYADLITRRLH